MVVMAEYLTQDRLSELKHHINQLHYSYLETEESPQKIDQRQKLEAYIKEYLCLVPNQHKFCFRETADVLHRSARNKTDFSGYRAALAWNALSMYAGNLLAQPWRKEYRTIRLYSGFYKHEIEANLVGAEIMLEVMGYKHVGDSVMILEGPICPDRVANVSRDSLVAFVECQIIKNIWEEISSRFKISWFEVLEFREKHICSPDQAVRALTFRWHERNYQSSQQHQPPPPTQIGQHPLSPPLPSLAQPIYNTAPITSHVIDNYARYQPLVVHAPPPQSTIYGTNPYYGYGTYATAPVTTYPTIPHQRYAPQYAPTTYQPVITPKTPIYSSPNNGYCCSPQNGSSNYITNSGYTQQIPRTVQVPTGQLIELDSVTYQEHPKKSTSYNNNTELTIPSPKARDEGTGTFESWDYVFRNLESQGYNKDVGQRGDLLCPESKSKTKRGTRGGEHKSMKISDALQKMRLDNDNYDSRINVAHSSSYDNLSSHSSSNNKGRNNYSVKTKSLPRESKTYEDKVTPTVSHTLDVKKSRTKTTSKNENVRHKEMPKDEVDNKKASSSSTSNSSKWHCNVCTYLNVPTKDICEMCGKSRSSITSPMPPMAVGGSECPKCTLINEKNVKICDACGASLTNSPTYI